MRFDKLLVLDLDETLIFATETPLGRPADFRVLEQFHIYKRPGLDDFLTCAMMAFDVAVWTSATSDYAREVIANIIPSPDKLAFVYCRDRCTVRRYPVTGTIAYVKNLGKLTRKGYRREKILVADDTPESYAKNYGNAIPVRKWHGEPDDTELPYLLKYLERIGDVEDVRTVEKRFWRNPIT